MAFGVRLCQALHIPSIGNNFSGGRNGKSGPKEGKIVRLAPSYLRQDAGAEGVWLDADDDTAVVIRDFVRLVWSRECDVGRHEDGRLGQRSAEALVPVEGREVLLEGLDISLDLEVELKLGIRQQIHTAEGEAKNGASVIGDSSRYCGLWYECYKRS